MTNLPSTPAPTRRPSAAAPPSPASSPSPHPLSMPDLFANYEHGRFYDEMFASPGKARPHYRRLFERFALMESMGELLDRQRTADQTFIDRGVTFTVYSDTAGTEKIFPFDLIPRIVPAHEWAHLESGLTQRMQALNLFLADIYSEQRILKEGV